MEGDGRRWKAMEVVITGGVARELNLCGITL